MQRRYEFIDLIVAIGLFATIVAGGFVFLAANGTLSLSSSRQSERDQPVGTSNGMWWLQPVLGQAILDHDLLDRHFRKVTPAATIQLNEVTGEHVRWQNSPFGYLDSIKMFAARAEADHATRVQAVLGRAILQFTRRGVLNGVLSPGEMDSPYNSRMIASMETLGRRMDIQFFADWQSNMGGAIVVATQDAAKTLARMQKRLGAAIVQLSAVQTTYEGSRSANQEQLGGATVVALQAGARAGLSSREETRQPQDMTVAGQRTWPEIPTSALVVASVLLMGLFMAGLLVAPTLPMAKAVESGAAAGLYPKAG